MTTYKLTATQVEPGLWALAVLFSAEDGAELLAGETTAIVDTEEQALEYGRTVYVPNVQRNERILRGQELIDADAPAPESPSEIPPEGGEA